MKCTRFVGLAFVALTVFLAGSAPGWAAEIAQITGGNFELNRYYRVGPHLRLKVSRTSGSNFESLVGPLPNASSGSYAVFSATEDATSSGDRIEFVINDQDGFVYMNGVQPYGGTDGGSSTSDGTSMIVQRIDESGTIYHRYFRLLATRNVDVTGVAPPDSKTITQDYYYVEKEDGEDLSDPMQIPTASETDTELLKIRQFVLDVLALARDTGLPNTPADPP